MVPDLQHTGIRTTMGDSASDLDALEQVPSSTSKLKKLIHRQVEQTEREELLEAGLSPRPLVHGDDLGLRPIDELSQFSRVSATSPGSNNQGDDYSAAASAHGDVFDCMSVSEYEAALGGAEPNNLAHSSTVSSRVETNKEKKKHRKPVKKMTTGKAKVKKAKTKKKQPDAKPKQLPSSAFKLFETMLENTFE